ncbi:MAG: DNA polymerase III subunit beta [Patescibacteria group bacterium]
MNFVILRDKLKEGLDIVSHFVNDGNNLPVLKNILVRADENKITLSATNLESGISFYIPCKVIQQGSFTAPANILSQVINNIQQDKINVEQKNSFFEIKTENYQASIQGISSEDFPIIPRIKNITTSLEIEGKILKEALDQTTTATQFSDLRPELNSILFSYGLNNITFVGTDSFRLAEKKLQESQFSSNEKKEWSVLLPLKTAQELSKTIKNEGKIKINKDENQILFKSENFEIISRTIEGAFPDYQAIMPKQFYAEITASREEFINALKLIGIMADFGNEITVRISPGKKAIELFSKSKNQGDNTYVLSAKIDCKKDAIETSFNWRFLLEGLKSISAEEIFFGINEENKPAILRAPQKGSYFYILMPILKG